MSVKNDIPQKQRALVLQGGGALGAYEAGALTVLCEYLSSQYRGNNVENGPLFDIIAGTSIGAMNAAVLVSNVVNKNKSWKEAAEVLARFWTDQAKADEKEDKKKGGLSSTPDFSKWLLDEEKKPKIFNASPEAVRKYYSVKEYLFVTGAPNFFYPKKPIEPDPKFQDNGVYGNQWQVYNSMPLEQTIKRYSKAESDENKDDDLRIATSWDKKQPRLLVISLDVADGKTVAFDSYHTEVEDPGNSLYDGDGITINHVMASGTLPELYKFRDVPKEGGRKFCDGGTLSNTPFRELLQAHRDYWKKKTVPGKDENKIPDLAVYIINVHPSRQHTVPAEDHDAVKNRINDITYSDRNSHYDEMAAELATAYTDLIDKLKELAKRHFKSKNQSGTTFQNEFEDILKAAEGKSSGGTIEDRKYYDLIKGRFKVTVTRIENESYEDSIYGKGADSTSKTIKDLIAKGKEDARRVLKLQ